jgi:hypothetical protein
MRRRGPEPEEAVVNFFAEAEAAGAAGAAEAEAAVYLIDITIP